MSWIFHERDNVPFIKDEHNMHIASVYTFGIKDWKRNGRLIAASKQMYELFSEMLRENRLSAVDKEKVISLLTQIDGDSTVYGEETDDNTEDTNHAGNIFVDGLHMNVAGLWI